MVLLTVEGDHLEDVNGPLIHELELGNQRFLMPSLVLGCTFFPPFPQWEIFLRMQPQQTMCC